MKTRRPHSMLGKSRLTTELTRQLGLIRLAVAAACFPAALFAAPQGAEFVKGAGSVTQTGNQTLIQAGNKSIIQYSGFNIGRGESVRFLQPGKNSTVLNRVLSNDPTRIFGQLQSNGKIYLVNPFGIFFQNGSMINVGGLYAASGKLSDGDFLSGTHHFTDLNGAVVNRGSIRSASDVSLAGGSVVNSGYINAPAGTVVIASGSDVLIGDRDGSVFVQAAPKQDAAQPPHQPKLAAGDLFSMAVVNSGVIQGKNITISGGSGNVAVSGKLNTVSRQSSGGKIEITGKKIVLKQAQLDASGKTGGGTILVGGDYQGGGDIPRAEAVLVDGRSNLSADALSIGNGGKVVVWSDDTTIFKGTISAKGGVAGGDGGLAEVSGKLNLSYLGNADLTAPLGNVGSLLLDPAVINIVLAAPASDDAAIDDFVVLDTDENPGNPPFAISASKLVTQLNTADVTLAATASINLQTTVDASANANAHGLTLTAPAITFEDNVNLILNNGALNLNGSVSIAGATTLGAGNGLITSGNITLLDGANLSVGTGATGGITLQSVSGTLGAAASNLTFNTSGLFGGPILINGPVGTDIGTLTVTSSSGITFANTVTAANVALTNTIGSIVFQGNLAVATALTTTASPYALTFNGTNNIFAGATNLQNLGPITIGNSAASDSLFSGGLSVPNATLNLAGTIRTTGSAINLNSPVTLTAATTLQGSALTLGIAGLAGGGNDLTLNLTTAFTLPGNLSAIRNFTAVQPINLGGTFQTSGSQTYNTGITLTQNSALNATAISVLAFGIKGGGFNFDLVSGAGTTVVSGTVSNVNNLTLQDNTPASTGSVTFNGDVSANALTTFAQSYDVSLLNGGTIVTATTFNNLGSLTLGNAAADSMTFTGGLTAIASPTIRLAGTISSAAAPFNLGAATLVAATTLQGSVLTLGGALSGANLDLTLDFTTGFTLPGSISGVRNFTSNQPINLAGNFETSGTQTYNGLLTLTGNSSLKGTLLTLAAAGLTSAGGNKNLTLDFSTPFTLSPAVSNIANFTSVKAINVSGVFETTGTQTYNAGLFVTGNATLDANGIGITNGGISGGAFDLQLISNAANIVVNGAVSLGGNLQLQENAATSTGSVTFNDNVSVATLTTSAQPYDIALLGGATIVNATIFSNTGVLTLGNSVADSNNFSGGLTATAVSSIHLSGNVSTTGANALVLGDLDTNIILDNDATIQSATGSISLGQIVGAGRNLDITSSTTNDLNLPATSLATLDVSTQGNIGQTGDLTILGNATFETAAATITLLNPGNAFSGAVLLANIGANDVQIQNGTSLTIGTIPAKSIGGNLLVTTAGALTFASTNIVGGISASAAGNISQTGTLIVGAPSTFTVTVANSDVSLASFANDLNGVTINTSGIGTLRDVALCDVSPSIVFNIPATLRNLTLQFDNAAIVLPTLTLTGDLIANAGGNISESGNLQILGNASLNAGSNDILLNTNTNNFGSVTFTGAAVAITQASDLVITGTNTASVLTLVANGTITNSTFASLNVTNNANLNAGTNAINLGASVSDLINFGTITVAGGAVTITEDSETTFTGINTASSLASTASGAISDLAGSTFAVSGNAAFNAGTNNITLGDSPADVTNFGSLTFNGNSVVITEDSGLAISGTSAANNLILTAASAITNTAGAALTVTNNAAFNSGVSNIVLGAMAGDSFQLGSLTFNGGDVNISADTQLKLAGVNTAASLSLVSADGITDNAGTSIQVTGNAILDAGANNSDIILGNNPGDLTNFGSLTFLGGSVSVSEDSATILTGLNIATTLELTSVGSITDALGTSLAVSNLATLNSGLNPIVLGDQSSDITTFGTLNFTGGDVSISLDNRMALVGINTAAAASLSSGADIDFSGTFNASSMVANAGGNITNRFNTRVNIANNASFNTGGNSVNLGFEDGDEINFGSLTFAAREVSISEDSATNLIGANTAGSIFLVSIGNITDNPGTSLVVTGNASFFADGNNITLGDSAGDTTNFGSFTFAGDVVSLLEDSGTVITGANAANSFSLISSGTITDTAGTTISVTNNARLNAMGGNISLGNNPGDSVNFGSLDLTGQNAVIAEDSDTNLAAVTLNSLDLTSAGSISQSGNLAISGTSTFTAANDVLLNSTTNDFGGLITASGAKILLRDVNTLNLGRIQASGALEMSAASIIVTANINALSTEFTGATTLRGISVTTGNFQNYNGILTLATGPSKLVSTGNGPITFARKINGSQGLVVTTGGLTSFNGDIGTDTPLASLTVDGGGTTQLKLSVVRTTGKQTWSDAITLDNRDYLFTTTAAGDILFGRSVDGAGQVAITTSGSTTFNSAVGRQSALRSLIVDGGGRTTFKAGSSNQAAAVTTLGNQTYADAVLLASSSTFVSKNNGQISFSGSVDSSGAPAALSINTSGTTRLSGDIGQSSSLLSLTTDDGGQTELADTKIRTSAAQSYQDSILLQGSNQLTAGTATFANAITGDSLEVSTTGGPLIFSTPVILDNLTAYASGGDLFIPNAETSGDLSLSSGSYIHLTGNSYSAGGSILFNANNPVEPQTPFSTIIAETGDLTIDAGQNFAMALHQRFFVTNGSLNLSARTATLGDTAASQNLIVTADSAVLLGREKITSGTREGDGDLGLSFVARTITFNAPLSYSDLSERQLANFSVEKGQPFVAKIAGVTLFEDVNIADQFLIDGFPIYQPVAGGVSQAEVAETIAGALSRKRDDKVAEDDNISDDDVKKLGEIGVFPRFYDGTQDLSLEKQFLYYQRDAFQNPKVPANYKVVTRRLQRELVTEVLAQSSKVNEMLPACQAAIERMQTEFKTTEAYTSEQAFLPYLETKLTTADGKIVKSTLEQLKVLFEKLPLLNLTNKEIDLAKNAISGRFPPTNLNGETDIALKRLLIENKKPEKALPVEKKPLPAIKSQKVAGL